MCLAFWELSVMQWSTNKRYLNKHFAFELLLNFFSMFVCLVKQKREKERTWVRRPKKRVLFLVQTNFHGCSWAKTSTRREGALKKRENRRRGVSLSSYIHAYLHTTKKLLLVQLLDSQLHGGGCRIRGNPLILSPCPKYHMCEHKKLSLFPASIMKNRK